MYAKGKSERGGTLAALAPLASFPLKSIWVKRHTRRERETHRPVVTASTRRDERKEERGENVTHKWPEERVGGASKMGERTTPEENEHGRRALETCAENITATPTSLHGENLLSAV